MSQPHMSKDLNFIKHPTKGSTYVPGRREVHHVMASVAVGLGLALLIIAGLLIVGFYNPW
jgi:hypothetical protein